MRNNPYYEILKKEREDRLLSQEKLAREIDADARLVRSWESGRRFPSYKYRQALCNFYGKSAEDLGMVRRADNDKRFATTDKTGYRSIVGVPPPTHAKIIQQRESTVKEIYEKLTQPDITAIAVTGIGGVGKSTLAALISNYAEEQYHAGKGPFNAEPLWLRVDPAVTMADLVGTIYESLGKPLPDLGRLSPQNQAMALLHILNTADKSLLVILDQFENLLDWQTGHTLTDRLGIGEWLDVINSQPCRCRILLTSRPWPQGTRGYPPTYMQGYHDKGLETDEGIELLQKQGVKATKEELRTAVENCEGHAFALTLLASFLRGHNLSLTALFKNSVYTQLWTGNIARNLLNSIYRQQLNQAQRKLLVAFSVYREPVRLDAVQAIIELFKVPQAQIELDLDVLLAQSLLQAYGEGYYQLHAIVASYLRRHFVEDDERVNHQTRLIAHTRAAQCYVQQAVVNCPPRALRRRISDVHDLVEAVWQWCQAEQWQEAYNLIRREGLFPDLMRWGGSAILLELFQLLLPPDKWHANRSQAARIYNDLGEVYNNVWQNERALDYCEQALQIFREIGDGNGEGMVLGILGWLNCILGQKKQALKYYEQALSIHRRVGNRGGEGIALNGLGLVHSMLGQKEQALDYYEQALSIRREVGDRGGEGKTLNGLGLVYAGLGQKEQALDYYRQALSIHREVGERGAEGRTLNNISLVYAELGQKEQALDYYRQALSISREIGDREGEGWVLTNLGKVYHTLEQREQALDCYKQALSISREVGDREGEGTILHYTGMLYFERKDYNVALACFLLAKSAFEEVLGLDRSGVQRWIDSLRKEIGEERFAALLDQIGPRAFQTVSQALSEGM